MPVLTLTTDWGLRDHYLASFKGRLINVLPKVQLIDISHEVERFNTMQAAFIIQNSFRKFPAGSIHFIGLSGNENCTIKHPFVIVRVDGHYLFGEDTGIFTLILGNSKKEIVRLNLEKNTSRNEMHESILRTLGEMHAGKFLELGKEDTVLQESYFAQPTVDTNTIRGTIIFIDSFGNAVVNISRQLFEQEKRNRKFIIHLRKSTYNVDEISHDYEDVEVGEMLALFNQDGFLEIALNKDSACKLLGLKLMDPIRIEFDDSQTG